MSKPIIRIHNTETNEVIDREMTAAEYKMFEDEKKMLANYEAEANAKVAARESALAKLAALGLTADEIAAL